jgi:ketosteroid isomerase-like protein
VGDSANVELVRAVFDAFSRRDAEALLRVCSPAMEFHAVTASLVSRDAPYRGHDGLRAYLRDAALVWSELRIDAREFRERDDVVVALGRVYAWGSGRVIDAPTGWVWRTAGGLVTYGRVFESQHAALEAGGMAA